MSILKSQDTHGVLLSLTLLILPVWTWSSYLPSYFSSQQTSPLVHSLSKEQGTVLSPLFLDCTFRNGLQRQASLPGKPKEQGKEGQWWLPRSSGVRMKDAREGFVPPTLTTWEMVIVLESGIPNIKSCRHVSGQSSERETVATDWSGLSAALSIWTSSIPYLQHYPRKPSCLALACDGFLAGLPTSTFWEFHDYHTQPHRDPKLQT